MDQNDPEYQEYLDYLEYQEYQNYLKQQGQAPAEPAPQSYAGVAQRVVNKNPTAESMISAGFGLGNVSNTARAAAPGLAQLLGKPFGSAGDYLMQKAAGMKKYIPGVGKTMADEGMIGTKGMLRKQAESSLTKHGQRIGELAAKIPGEIDNAPVADKIGSLAERRILSTGEIPAEESKAVGQILGKAHEVAASPPMSGKLQAEMRAMAGRRAREMGAYKTVPSAQVKSQLASAEQAGRSEALKQAYGKAFPNQPNALAESDAAYSALSKVQAGLNNPDSLSAFEWATKLSPAAIGAATGGLPGAAIGAALSTSAGQSITGRGLIGLEKLIGNSGPLGSQSAIKFGRERDKK